MPTHTETWAYDDSSSADRCNGGYGASRKLVRNWLTYAETNCGPRARKAGKDCRTKRKTYCTVIAYFDANKVWSGSPIRKAPSRENWWLHQPGHTNFAHRLQEHLGGLGVTYWLDQMTRDAQKWIHQYLRSHYNTWDGLMMDDTSACREVQFYGSGYTSSEEIRTDAGVIRAHRELARVLTHRNGRPFLLVDNGIQPNPWTCSSLPLLNRSSGVLGLVSEGNPWDDGFSAYYSSLLDVMAAVDSRKNDFIVLLSYDQNGSDTGRLVQEATVLLGYEQRHVVSWADLEQSSHDLAVWPEEGIYPTDPIQSMNPPRGSGCMQGKGRLCKVGGHNNLRVARGSNTTDHGAGVYRREFGQCYNRGVPFGPCAAIVNDTSSAVVVRASWLAHTYGHEITLTGGDVQSGGKLNLTGATFTAGQTIIPPDNAILLSK